MLAAFCQSTGGKLRVVDHWGLTRQGPSHQLTIPGLFRSHPFRITSLGEERLARSILRVI